MQSRVPHPQRNGEYLYLMFDYTHNFKNIYNNWVNKKIFSLPASNFIEAENGVVANFHEVKKVYLAEESKPLKMAHKLTNTCLAPTSIQRTSPRHALGEL